MLPQYLPYLTIQRALKTMDASTRYINTDLDLASPVSLKPLLRYLKANDFCVLHHEKGNDKNWTARLELCCEEDTVFANAEATICTILDCLEKMPDQTRTLWKNCTARECNAGYECVEQEKHHSYGETLSPATLHRMAVLNIAFGLTLYTYGKENSIV